jgi:ferredoxin
MAMTISPADCTACGACESECPSRAIRFKGAAYAIDPKKCTECDGVADAPQCDAVCPAGAIAKAA